MFQGARSVSKLARAKQVLAKRSTAPLQLSTTRTFMRASTGAMQLSHSTRTTVKMGLPSSFSVRKMSGTSETMEFQAETRKLLDIVTNSIYTDREVFLRELISNASDALEKYRYQQVTGEATGSDIPLEINIITDEKAKTLTIVDSGIGMSREDLIANLGTIARSGSKQFVENLKNSAAPDSKGSAADGIIGQFGVGFYSSFMVSDSVDVESQPAGETSAHKWSSDGSGQFTIDGVSAEEAAEHLAGGRGSRITMHLKESCAEYAQADKIKSIIKKYSAFVSFPVKVNGEVVNTVQAIWAQDKTTITEEQYNDFYRFIATAYDKPMYRLHFRADAPIELKCLFYVPRFHSEKFGMGRIEPGVNLYSRKVLIESKPADLLPGWLRFLKGAVDSEDLPLSLSREKPQNSALLRRIRDVLTRKFLRFLADEAKNNPTTYREFYVEYHMFLKEGLCQDYTFMSQISKLMLFESSAAEAGEMVSLDDYISRCAPEQKHIYYLIAPSRDAALQSPYYETFKKHKKEVLLLYNTIDDFVMNNLKEFGGRTLLSAETSSIDLSKEGSVPEDAEDENKEDSKDKKASVTPLTDAEAEDCCTWLSMALTGKVSSVKITKRLSDSPAIVTDHESGALRRMMKMVEQANAGAKGEALPPQNLEINPSHPLIVNLYSMKDDPSSVAGLVAEQMLDNCLMAAGLIEDPRYMLPRLNDLLLATTQHHKNEREYDAQQSKSE